MEQKKILWIFLAVASFVLIIFVFALVLYAPSRSTGPALQSAVITPAPSATTSSPSDTRTGIDPDSWVREPEKAPGLDSTMPPPANGNINLTIVNGDNAGANYGTLDVSGLTKPATQDGTVIQNGQNLPVLPGQSASPAAGSQTDAAQPKTAEPAAPSSAKTETEKAVTVKSAAAGKGAVQKPAAAPKQAPAPAKKEAAKSVPKKAVTVTEYWIQTGSFTSKLNAEKARDTLEARYLDAEIFTRENAGTTTYRVRIGPYKTKAEADYWLGTVKEIPDFSGSYVSEVKNKK
jgi:Cell division protein